MSSKVAHWGFILTVLVVTIRHNPYVIELMLSLSAELRIALPLLTTYYTAGVCIP